MIRLFDVVRGTHLAAMADGSTPVPVTVPQNTRVFDCTSVYEFIRGTLPKWDADKLCLVPPFPEFWVEYETKEGSNGALFRQCSKRGFFSHVLKSMTPDPTSVTPISDKGSILNADIFTQRFGDPEIGASCRLEAMLDEYGMPEMFFIFKRVGHLPENYLTLVERFGYENVQKRWQGSWVGIFLNIEVGAAYLPCGRRLAVKANESPPGMPGWQGRTNAGVHLSERAQVGAWHQRAFWLTNHPNDPVIGMERPARRVATKDVSPSFDFWAYQRPAAQYFPASAGRNSSGQDGIANCRVRGRSIGSLIRMDHVSNGPTLNSTGSTPASEVLRMQSLENSSTTGAQGSGIKPLSGANGSKQPNLTGLVDAALEIAGRRRQMLGRLRSALEGGKETDALHIARQLCGLSSPSTDDHAVQKQ